MAKLALSRDMLSDYAALQKRAQSRVAELADMFQRMTAEELRGSKGIHLEAYAKAKDPRARTIRIDDNHRGVVIDAGDDSTYVLIRIGTHDEIDRWMMHNVARVNEATGALEIVNLTAIEAALSVTPAPVSEQRLFAHRSDKEFRQLGIPEYLLPTLRAFETQEQLLGLLQALPQNQADALIELTGNESVDVLFGLVAGDIDPAKIDTDDVAAALEAPASKSQFRIMTDEAELASVLALPLAQWRTYLHTSQEQLARKPIYNGPVRVTGGAGTGKTVVAMHRAAALAAQLPEQAGTAILFTTFTRNLAQVIESDLRLLGGSGLLDDVEVRNVDSLAYRVVQEAEGGRPVVIGSDEVMKLWNDIVDETGIEFSASFLNSEWEHVILALGCASRSDYFAAPRSGRGLRLDRRGRAEVWKAVEALTQSLADQNRRTYLQLAQAAAGYLAARQVKPYRHVIVDEAQDLHETQWRLLRAAVAEGPNDLFIVGDSHQRIYDRKSSLSKVGINIVGRSHRLRINYRTTHEILGWSLALLGEGEYDDLDTGTDPHDFAGYHSFLHGNRPVTLAARSKREEYAGLVERVRSWIDLGIEPDEIGVAARASGSIDAIDRALREASVPTVVLGPDLPSANGVRIATMHRLKGLEFRAVAIVDVDDDNVPAHWELTDRHADEVQFRADLQRELCLLYVACTRAREELWVGWSGKPSRFLEPVL